MHSPDRLSTPPVRAELVEAGACWFEKHACVEGGGRESPGMRVTFFWSPKESHQRKGDPTRCVPSLRCGQPAVLASSGVSLELASLRQSRALIRWPLRSSAHPEGNPGLGHPHGPLLRCAALGPKRAGAARRDREAERSKGPCGCSAVGCSAVQTPAGCACGGAVAG
jgi:hypothetical protein